MKQALRPAVLLVAALVLSIWPSTALADNPERIPQFRSQIVIDKDATADITETIEYDFAGNQRRGIFRDIPTRYEAEGRNSFYQVKLEVQGVRRDGEEVVYEVIEEETYTRIRIGDPADLRPRQSEVYSISYRLSPVAYQYDEVDAIQIDITGNRWDVPIDNMQAQISLPTTARNEACFSGSMGSQQQDCFIATEGTSNSVMANNVDAGEGVTVYMEFPKDSFGQYLEARTDTGAWVRMAAIAAFIAVMAGSLGGIATAHIRYIWRKRQKLVIPEYEPPNNLSPAEVGLLNDNTSNQVEFTATIIDLAVRGYIKIDYRKKGWFIFKSNKYTFHKTKEFDDKLRDYEREILETMFGEDDKVELGGVDKKDMHKTLKDMHKTVKESLVDKGYYRPQHKWMKKITKGSGAVFVILVIAFVFWPLAGLIILGLITGIASWRGVGTMASRMTRKGYSGWADIEGFKEFLSLTEKERMDFHEAPERQPEEFSQFLPYAVALGVEKKWAKQFESLKLPSQNWAAGSSGTAMANAGFIGGLSSGLSSYAKSSYSGNSGGFSGGGGFSSGGVGGGGGGSW